MSRGRSALVAFGLAIPLALAPAALADASTTYRAAGASFQMAFPSRVTKTVLTKAELGSSLSGVSLSATLFSSGMKPREAFPSNNAVPPPDAFAVLVITFRSASAASSDFQGVVTSSGGKRVTIDGRKGVILVGNVVTLDSASPGVDKKATAGHLAVLDGNSILAAGTVTKQKTTTTSFLNSLRILS